VVEKVAGLMKGCKSYKGSAGSYAASLSCHRAAKSTVQSCRVEFGGRRSSGQGGLLVNARALHYTPSCRAVPCEHAKGLQQHER